MASNTLLLFYLYKYQTCLWSSRSHPSSVPSFWSCPGSDSAADVQVAAVLWGNENHLFRTRPGLTLFFHVACNDWISVIFCCCFWLKFTDCTNTVVTYCILPLMLTLCFKKMATSLNFAENIFPTRLSFSDCQVLTCVFCNYPNYNPTLCLFGIIMSLIPALFHAINVIFYFIK